jgi:ribonuclease Z
MPSAIVRAACFIVLFGALTAAVPPPQAPAIRVVLLGTGGGPNSINERGGPAAWVDAGGERLFIDAGRSVVTRLGQAGLAPRDVTRVFLTHLHSDHAVGLPELWLSGWWMFREAPLEVRGPSGTRAMIEHLRQAYSADVDLRTAPPERLRRETAAISGVDIEEGVVYEANGVRVTAIRVDHGPVPTFGYRIDHAGRAVVFSGDDRRSDNLIAKSQNVDVLFHNMTAYTPEQLREEGRRGDAIRAGSQLLGSPEDAAAVFTASHCKVAVLIHSTVGPPALQRLRAGFTGRLEVPDDLTEILVGDEVIVRPIKR